MERKMLLGIKARAIPVHRRLMVHLILPLLRPSVDAMDESVNIGCYGTAAATAAPIVKLRCRIVFPLS